MTDLSKTSGSSPPAKPANYDQLEYADQVKHHIAVLRWKEANPDIVQAEQNAKEAADKIARRARAEADLKNNERLLAIWKTDGSSAARIADLEESMAEDQAALDKEDAQAKADAKWLVDLGDSEPVNPDPEMPRHNPPAHGVPSYELWWSAIDAWKKANPDIVAQREAEERAEYEAEQVEPERQLAAWKAANPKKIAAIIKAVGIDKLTKPIEVEHVTEAAIMRMIDDTDADELEKTSVKEYADDLLYQIMSEPRRVEREAKRLKRDAKNPAKALERARDAAQREEMEAEKDEAKVEARQNGEAWGDISDEWQETWIEDNWDAEAEAEFIVSFENHWLKDHGTPFPALAEAETKVPEPKAHGADDAKLAADIGAAIKAYDAADAVKKEKAIIAGQLLAEARKRHPGKKAFENFLELAGGIGIRRAETFIAIALGRKDFEQHQIENAAAQQRHRNKLKAEKIEREKAKAALPKPEPKPAEAKPGQDNEKPEPKLAEPEQPSALRNAQISAASLREFEAACRSFLPQLNKADLKKAVTFVTLDKWRSKTQKEAA